MPERQLRISEAELAILEVLWENGSATLRTLVEEAAKQGRCWAQTTVQTLLTRLRRKGCVKREKGEYANVYSPAVSREHILAQGLSDLADRFSGGMASPLVRALVRSRRLSAEDVEELKQLVEELDSESPRKTRRARKRKR